MPNKWHTIPNAGCASVYSTRKALTSGAPHRTTILSIEGVHHGMVAASVKRLHEGSSPSTPTRTWGSPEGRSCLLQRRPYGSVTHTRILVPKMAPRILTLATQAFTVRAQGAHSRCSTPDYPLQQGSPEGRSCLLQRRTYGSVTHRFHFTNYDNLLGVSQRQTSCLGSAKTEVRVLSPRPWDTKMKRD